MDEVYVPKLLNRIRSLTAISHAFSSTANFSQMQLILSVACLERQTPAGTSEEESAPYASM